MNAPKKNGRFEAAYLNPLNVFSVLDLARADALASRFLQWHGRLALATDAINELVSSAHRADGDERPGRPERGVGYSDAEWAIFLQGWDSHAEATYRSGLRRALAPFEKE